MAGSADLGRGTGQHEFLGPREPLRRAARDRRDRLPTVDAFAHVWDISSSVGRPIELSPELLPAISALVDRVCTEPVCASGLIAAAQETPADATETERLMAFAGRSISR